MQGCPRLTTRLYKRQLPMCRMSHFTNCFASTHKVAEEEVRGCQLPIYKWSKNYSRSLYNTASEPSEEWD